MLLLILNVLTEVNKKECFLLQKITCSTEQWGFPNMKGMVLHQGFPPHFFFVYYQERKSDRTWRDTDRTRRSQRWRKQVRQNHRPKPGRWGPFDWSLCSQPVKCVTTRDLEVVTLFVEDEPTNGYNLPVCAPKNLEWSARSGELFFWGLEWNEMVNCSAKKNVYISMSLSHL